MNRYLLAEGFELCGWEGLPFGLRYPNGAVDFFDRESYVSVLFCDGQHDLDSQGLTEKQKSVLERLVKMNICAPCREGERLKPQQIYTQYGCYYKRDVQWSITGRCNYRCRHCFMWANEGLLGEPTREQYLAVIEGLHACGIRNVELTGGEPLICENLEWILDELAKRRMRVSSLYTNGALLDDTVLDAFAKREFYPSVQLSFDGIGWHDWLRGVEGAEAEVLRAMALLQRRNVAFSASMCLHRHNLASLEESLKLLASYGCEGAKANIASPMGAWAEQKEHFAAREEAYAVFLDMIPRYWHVETVCLMSRKEK